MALAFQFRSFRQPLQLTEARLLEASFQVGLLTSQSKTLHGGNARKTIEKDRKTWENPWKSLGNLVGKSTATIVGSSNPVKANGFL